jgi:histidinol-phosphate aminotransferase
VGYSRARIAELARAYRGLLVVDEAYAPFAREHAVALIQQLPNVCVVRTFSKSHALAGIRCGYLIGSPSLVELLDRLRDSYNLDRLTQVAATAAIEDADYYEALCTKIRDTRDYYAQVFGAMGWFTYPSEANFLLTEPRTASGAAGAEVARALYEHLLSKRILVRLFPNHPLTAGFLRITVGDDEQMLTLLETLQAWQRNA